jgi:hypothetical protein
MVAPNIVSDAAAAEAVYFADVRSGELIEML